MMIHPLSLSSAVSPASKRRSKESLCWIIACALCIFSSSSAQALPVAGTMAIPAKRTTTGSNPSLLYKENSPTQRLSVLPLSSVSLGNPFWKACGIYAASDMFGFLMSLMTGSHLHLDLIGTGAFALASIPNVIVATTTESKTMGLSQKVSSLAVSIWAIKLATFLCYRATQVRHDNRLTDTLATISGTFGFWFITFMWNVCCSLPYILGLLSNRSNRTMVQVGGLMFLIGFALETTADLQKWFFKQSHPPGQFCNVGLWSISQHPNFLGNLVLWMGIFIMNLPSLIVPPTKTATTTTTAGGFFVFVWRYRRVGLALLSPLFMWGLFYGQASGVVTNANQLALSKYGKDPKYLTYIEEVPKIVPKLVFGRR